MTHQNAIKIKSYRFALEVISAYKYLHQTEKEFILSKQLLRSGTSIAAMVRESEYAQSKSDFIHKMSIAIKECNETLYWLELLKDSKYISQPTFTKLRSLGVENLKLLTAIINTTKSSLSNLKNK